MKFLEWWVLILYLARKLCYAVRHQYFWSNLMLKSQRPRWLIPQSWRKYITVQWCYVPIKPHSIIFQMTVIVRCSAIQFVTVFVMLNLHDNCRFFLPWQMCVVHIGTPLLVQVHVLQSRRQLVPGLQVAVHRSNKHIIILINENSFLCVYHLIYIYINFHAVLCFLLHTLYRTYKEIMKFTLLSYQLVY
jgi:hypothetical protein